MNQPIILEKPLTSEELLHFLPQRFPMLMVDRVLSVDADGVIVGIKNVTINEPFFQGHFPDKPIMPGVMILEAMAQISGVLGLLLHGRRPEDGKMFLFAGVDKVRFKRRVIPGDTLTLTARLITSKKNIYKFTCQANVGDELAASAEILIAEQQMEIVQ